MAGLTAQEIETEIQRGERREREQKIERQPFSPKFPSPAVIAELTYGARRPTAQGSKPTR